MLGRIRQVLVLGVLAFVFATGSRADTEPLLGQSIAVNASSVSITGPAVVPIGQCVAFTITALDGNGQALQLAHNQRVRLDLIQSASVRFSAKSSCSKAQKEYVIKAKHSAITFYVEDQVSEEITIQPILNPHSSGRINGLKFDVSFVSNIATPTPTQAATPTTTPTVLATRTATPTSVPTPTFSATRIPSPTPTSSPSTFGILYDACWFDKNGDAYQALDFKLTKPYGPLVLQGELYIGEGCDPKAWNDQLNDTGAADNFGTLGWIFYFIYRPNITDVSVVWSFSDTSGNELWNSGCENYISLPPC